MPPTKRTSRKIDVQKEQADSDAGLPAGRWDAQKAEKRERIKSAARALFSRYGYEATTIRKIAERAGVALGTVSLYATDKRDLIMLMFNDEISELIDSAAKGIREEAEYLENLLTYCQAFYVDFGSNLKLSRTFLMLNFFGDGLNSAAMKANNEKLLRDLRTIVELAKARGEVHGRVDTDLVAEANRLMFAGALRLWVAQDSPSVRAGISRLRELYQLQFRGYAAPEPARS